MSQRPRTAGSAVSSIMNISQTAVCLVPWFIIAKRQKYIFRESSYYVSDQVRLRSPVKRLNTLSHSKEWEVVSNQRKFLKEESVC